MLELTGSRSVETYTTRLDMAGLTGFPEVLDAGCGIGQWARAFILTGSRVTALDLTLERLAIASEINRESPPGAFRTVHGSISALPFQKETFDVVFCYGTLMFADVQAALQEFYRVLRPGGVVYVNISSWGWYVNRALRPYRFGLGPAKMIARTLLRRRSGVVLSRSNFEKILLNHGFSVEALGPEATCTLHETEGANDTALSFYPGRILGMSGVVEALGRKPVL